MRLITSVLVPSSGWLGDVSGSDSSALLLFHECLWAEHFTNVALSCLILSVLRLTPVEKLRQWCRWWMNTISVSEMGVFSKCCCTTQAMLQWWRWAEVGVEPRCLSWKGDSVLPWFPLLAQLLSLHALWFVWGWRTGGIWSIPVPLRGALWKVTICFSSVEPLAQQMGHAGDIFLLDKQLAKINYSKDKLCRTLAL